MIIKVWLHRIFRHMGKGTCQNLGDWWCENQGARALTHSRHSHDVRVNTHVIVKRVRVKIRMVKIRKK